MGDPAKLRKQFSTPAHPWQGIRMDDEDKLVSEYGLKNKREVWKSESYVRKFRYQAKDLIGTSADERKEVLIKKLSHLGVLEKGAKLEDILALDVRNFLDRRIQTLLSKKGIAKTPREARQMILHEQITLDGKKHKSPGTLVLLDDESKISYIGPSRKLRKPKPKVKKEPEAEIPVEATSAEEKPVEEPKQEEQKEEVKKEPKSEIEEKPKEEDNGKGHGE